MANPRPSGQDDDELIGDPVMDEQNFSLPRRIHEDPGGKPA